ncbi:MAG: hypothetical protein AAF208_06030 [Cyanobacteria bacterium P01_A01_bin.45]
MTKDMRLLYLSWSEEIKDTKTQINENFESTYTYGPWVIGMIWAESKPGMIPLYLYWSDVRKDSLLSTKLDIPASIYNKGPWLQGYVFKDKGDGEMIPLYQSWSETRKDTRVYTDPSAKESMYGNSVILGYIRPIKTLNIASLASYSQSQETDASITQTTNVKIQGHKCDTFCPFPIIKPIHIFRGR